MAAFSSPQSDGDSRLSTSVDMAVHAAVLPRSWPVHTVDTLDAFAQADASEQRTPPVVLQIPDLEALEPRNVEPRSWMHSPVVLKGAGMMASVIVTIIVAAIAASFKTHPAQPTPTMAGDAPTWQAAAPDLPAPQQVYGPPVAETFEVSAPPSGAVGDPYRSISSQSADVQDYQAAPQISAKPEIAPTQTPSDPARASVETARSVDAAQSSRRVLAEWPNFNPPREESASEEADDVKRGIYRNPFVEPDDQQGAADSRSELRTADSRAGAGVGDATRRDEVPRATSEAAPVARLKGTIIKSNSDRSYGNTGSSLH